MDYIQFGSTGLKVSRLAFGMALIEQTDENLGALGWNLSEDQLDRLNRLSEPAKQTRIYD